MTTIATSKTSLRSRHVREVRQGNARSRRRLVAIISIGVLSTFSIAGFGAQAAIAATPTVNLGTATPFAVIGGSTITNTGSSVISGNIGLSPGTSITGFPPGVQSTGVTDLTNAVALQAKNDTTAAYLDAAGRTPSTTAPSDLGGSTLMPGVYQSSSAMSLTGSLTLNGGGNADAVFIFQAGSTLISASGSTVVLENGAQACNVFWQVGSSATLGTSSNFAGTILALTSATLDTGATLNGRVLARNGAVTLDTNTITVPTCLAVSATSTTTTVATTTTTSAVKTTTTTSAKKTTTTTSAKKTTTKPKGAGTSKPKAPTTPKTHTVIPRGAPKTGLGDSVMPGPSSRTLLGVGALLLAGFAVIMSVRSRRGAGVAQALRGHSDS
jgi:cell division septation protein DedD